MKIFPQSQGRTAYTSRTQLIFIAAILLPITVIATLSLPLGALLHNETNSAPCFPTAAEECGCISDAAASAGIKPADDRELNAQQRSYSEADFTHQGISSSYRVFDNFIDPSQPVGVLIRLHGDGAYEYRQSSSLASCLAAVAAAHNLILVQPLTPSQDRTWWTDLRVNTQWLQALYEERITTLEDVDPTQTWWMGYSGGAEMISYGLLPNAIEMISGGAIMVAGGGAPRGSTEIANITTAQQSRLPLVWATGKRDSGADPAAPFDALNAARRGSAFYQDLGFDGVRTDFSRDADHFTIDEVNVLHSSLGT
ncbi:hypothetical protein [Corynebacterium alimapuense]|uniref:Alpha/beta hydrolase n=1 Tax=Corynebacterium alimapuense TaxID=1576874 RepID=A0A3M8K8J7_9CORY|nr:hypothetical protein [Corynebacterium alimapuense]RNE49541.1 hypothetical protein C5L39_04105 [Corynebacterium alimapuense]